MIKNKDVCYYCGNKSTSSEHVPPRMMFRGFSCDRITVPSCKDHNNDKGGSDQVIVSGFLIPLKNLIGKYTFEKEVLEAVKIGQSSFERTKRKAISSPLTNDPPESMPNVVYLEQSIDIGEWIRQLTSALIYDANQAFDPQIDWTKAEVFSSNWVRSEHPSSLKAEEAATILINKNNIQKEFDKQAWSNGWSASSRPYPKNIYYFQLHLTTDNMLGFKHVFYNTYIWYILLKCSEDIKGKLREKL